MKIPFDIKYRPQIESGKYKVVTEDDEPARIICWDSTINKERPIIAIVFDGQIEQYKANGRYDNDYDTCNYDLFIVTPEKEMTEFEKVLGDIIKEAVEKEVGDNASIWAIGRGHSEKLLALARKELCKQIVDHTKEAYENGKNEALKNLPK